MSKTNKNKKKIDKICLPKNNKIKISKYKFNMKKIIKERQIDSENRKKFLELDNEIKLLDNMYTPDNHNSDNDDEQSLVSPLSIYADFDNSKYNIPFEDDSNVSKSCSKRLHIMSIEINRLQANIHYMRLIKENWSPNLKDIQKIFSNWCSSSISFTNNKTMSADQITSFKKVGWYNFELVMNYITYIILKKDNELSKDDLLQLAKFTVNIYFDIFCGPMLNAIKSVFNSCIKKALDKANENSIISFTEKLFLERNKNSLHMMVIDLFLPIENPIAKKMYTYLAYKLYMSLLEKTNDMNPFPSSINDWFVQDLVNKNYFKNQPSNVLSNVIKLLEHVVIVFNLYEDEKKLDSMYHFLRAALGLTTDILDSQILINILDQWRLQLFRLQLNQNCDT